MLITTHQFGVISVSPIVTYVQLLAHFFIPLSGPHYRHDCRRNSCCVALHQSSSLPHRFGEYGHKHQTSEAPCCYGGLGHRCRNPDFGRHPSYVHHVMFCVSAVDIPHRIYPSGSPFQYFRRCWMFPLDLQHTLGLRIRIHLAADYWHSLCGLLLYVILLGHYLILPHLVAGLTLRAFAKRRSQFKQLLSAHSNLNSNRYFRLMGLSGIELLSTIPISSWVIYSNSADGVEPWKGWEDTHSHFSRVDQFPSLIWRNGPAHFGIEFTRWSIVVCAFIFFAFFGFADEARKNYHHVFSSVAKRVGYSTGSISSGETSANGYVLVVPTFPRIDVPSAISGKTGISDLNFKGLPSLPILVRQETTRTTDGDSIASYNEKAPSWISVSSSFNDAKGRSYSPPSISGSSASSVHDRDYSPPRHPQPAVVPFSAPRHQHDMV
jgi:hypothetical protein